MVALYPLCWRWLMVALVPLLAVEVFLSSLFVVVVALILSLVPPLVVIVVVVALAPLLVVVALFYECSGSSYTFVATSAEARKRSVSLRYCCSPNQQCVFAQPASTRAPGGVEVQASNNRKSCRKPRAWPPGCGGAITNEPQVTRLLPTESGRWAAALRLRKCAQKASDVDCPSSPVLTSEPCDC